VPVETHSERIRLDGLTAVVLRFGTRKGASGRYEDAWLGGPWLGVHPYESAAKHEGGVPDGHGGRQTATAAHGPHTSDAQPERHSAGLMRRTVSPDTEREPKAIRMEEYLLLPSITPEVGVLLSESALSCLGCRSQYFAKRPKQHRMAPRTNIVSE
jgi:hypothetical protein